jgi:hypothetical protein
MAESDLLLDVILNKKSAVGNGVALAMRRWK